VSQARLLAIEKVIIKSVLEKLVAMPACPESSRKSPKIMANDDIGLNVVNWNSEKKNL